MGNNLTTSVVIIFLFPLSIFIFTNLALRKLPSIGLYDIDFDVWIYPSMIYLVAGLCILPSIFRDVFDLRVHKKVLSYLSLSPHSKRYMILSFSVVSIVESLIFGLVSIILFSALVPYPFGFIKTVGFIFYFSIYVFLLSNVFITIAILSDKLSTILISVHFPMFSSGSEVPSIIFSNSNKTPAELSANTFRNALSKVESFLIFSRDNFSDSSSPPFGG